jgi:hypothetical protein
VSLKADWDSRGSAEIRVDAIAFALTMLGQVMPPKAPAPAIVPLGHGGIQLIWHRPALDIEAEIVAPNQAIVYRLDKATGSEEETKLTTDFSILSELLWRHFNT